MGPKRPAEIYDEIGRSYGRHRRPDARIAAVIEDALGAARTVINVASGTGSYEPTARRVIGVEPSMTMIRQRPRGFAPVVRAAAESLPFADRSFDAALAILTIHHWVDYKAGLLELTRVAPLQVVLTWDPALVARFWLVADYLPDIARWETGLPTVSHVEAMLNVTDIRVVPVPWDCTDAFLGAYWRRPETYIDSDARAAISGIGKYEPSALREAMARLERDLADGTWKRRNQHLLAISKIDLGYRLVIACGARA